MLFMIDIETTGINAATEELLEIGIVEMKKDERGMYQPNQSFQKILYSSREPVSEFAKKYQVELYRQANLAPRTDPHGVRFEMLRFFRACGAESRKDVNFCGWNASSFDVPFLHIKGFLEAPGYRIGEDGKDYPVGDHDYQYYEMGGAISLVQDILGVADRKQLAKQAEELGKKLTTNPFEGTEHTALFDCMKQMALLNGLIQLAQTFRSEVRH